MPEKSTVALVLLEYQNEFTSEGGKQYDAVKPVIEQENNDGLDMLGRSVQLLKGCRERGLEVFHVPISFTSSFDEIPDGKFGILSSIKENALFEENTWNSEFYEPMKPIEDEVVIKGKKGLCAFHTTDLDKILKEKNIDTIILAGFLTNCCIDSTMRTAYELGYNIMTVTDCTATNSLDAQVTSVDHTFPMFSLPLSHDSLLENIDNFININSSVEV